MNSTEPEAGTLHELRLRDYTPVPALRRPETAVERPRFPAIDIHNHLGRWLTPGGGWMTPDLPALCDLMDAVGVERIVNLDGRWGDELVENLERYDRAYPDRFVTFCHLDWSALRGKDPTGELVAGLRRSHAEGARGVKVW